MGKSVCHTRQKIRCMCVPTYLGAGLMAITDEPLGLSIRKVW